jgi:CheY-like chemotaxis protein/nitrogen-specific signal transduction histidine kinase
MLLAAFAVIRPLETSVLSAQQELLRERRNARAADIAKSEFLATMSHEIRTPLNGVLGMTELLESTELDDRQKMFTEIIQSSGQALLGVINDILDFSKIDAGRLVIDPQPFRLEFLASESTRLIGRAAEAKGLDLLVRLQPGLPSAVIGDLRRIRQVVTNLLSNAVKFTQKGQIVIDLSGAERFAADGARLLDLRVEVRDTGHGIAPDRIGKMFERFTQADSSHTRMQEGTGLGLAISKGLIELMGGQIGATSQLDRGSTFWFSLSLPIDGTGDPAPRVSSEIEGRRILVVDDNETNLRFLQEQLATWRLVTAAASSGRVGLQRLLANARDNVPFDLVVLDQGLPDMTSQEFLRALRASPAVAATPAIVLASVTAERDRTVTTEPGALQYVVKPPMVSVLFDAIAVALAGDTAPDTAKRKPIAVDTAISQLKPPGTSVLLVEDNHINSLYARQLLDKLGFDHLLAKDGKAAVEMFNEFRPLLILMDISMPIMDGYEATRHIRAHEAKYGLERTPIVAMTAHAMQGDREKCLAAGMDDYMSKPVFAPKLAEMLAKWLPAANCAPAPESTESPRRSASTA